MDGISKQNTTLHVAAVPYPGRGHVNPMMNLCKSLAATEKHLLVTFIVTEEWLDLIDKDKLPSQIQFRTIPNNILPSELVRGSDFAGFYEAVMTRMEAPVQQVLDRLQPPPCVIVADTELVWAVPTANRMNIPVASLWTMSASVFSIFRYFGLVRSSCLQANTNEYTDIIPGISQIRVSDLPTIFQGDDERVSKLALDCVSKLENAEFVLVNTLYELETQVIDALKEKCHFPIYPIGPAIPFSGTQANATNPTASQTEVDYLQWLDSQPADSVLYISLGSYLSVSDAQTKEIAAGVRQSGVRFLWISLGGDSSRLAREVCGDSPGLVVPWCDQMRVLRHPSVGGFWTHCGWNSTLESIYAGVPMLTFPIFFDQTSNEKQIVEDWKIGRRVRKPEELEMVVTSDEISDAVEKFMDPNDFGGSEIRERARQLGIICRKAVENGGSAAHNLDELIKDITKCCHRK